MSWAFASSSSVRINNSRIRHERRVQQDYRENTETSEHGRYNENAEPGSSDWAKLR